MNRFCGKCGASVDEQTGLCPNCDMPQSAPEQPKKPKNKKNGKIIAVSVISVVLCFTIIFTALLGWKLFTKEDAAVVNTEEQNEKEKEKVPPIYGKVSEQYAKAMLQRENNAGKGEYVNDNLISKFKDNDKYKVFFSLVDINKDGTTELIIGGGEDKNNTKIYDIFTNDGKNPVALFPVGSIGNEKTLDVYDNGNIKVTNDKSPTLQQYDYFNLPENSTSVSHQMGLTEDDGKYYKHDENGNYISGLTQKEFNEIVDDFESAKIKTEWTEFVPEDYVSEEDLATPEALTEEQLESFNDLLNAEFDIWGYKVEGSTINEYYINNYIYNRFFASEEYTMYDHYFPGEIQKGYSDPLNKFGETYAQNMGCYIYDADKVLFILNDIFGLGVTTDEATDYYYFKDDKFYYAEAQDSVGTLLYDEYEITSCQMQSDGYYLINVTHYSRWGGVGTVEGIDEMEFVVKPCAHAQYGDYWEIKDMKSKDVTDNVNNWQKDLTTGYWYNADESEYIYKFEDDGMVYMYMDASLSSVKNGTVKPTEKYSFKITNNKLIIDFGYQQELVWVSNADHKADWYPAEDGEYYFYEANYTDTNRLPFYLTRIK